MNFFNVKSLDFTGIFSSFNITQNDCFPKYLKSSRKKCKFSTFRVTIYCVYKKYNAI